MGARKNARPARNIKKGPSLLYSGPFFPGENKRDRIDIKYVFYMEKLNEIFLLFRYYLCLAAASLE
jgi:hypothetical protein